MAVVSFSRADEDIVDLSGRTLDLLINRAVPRLSDASEAEELRMCSDVDGISFQLFQPEARERVAGAVRDGTLELERELETGVEPLPNFGAGNIAKLDEILALIDRFIPASGTAS
jgi:hypothetical protein